MCTAETARALTSLSGHVQGSQACHLLSRTCSCILQTHRTYSGGRGLGQCHGRNTPATEFVAKLFYPSMYILHTCKT